MKATLQILVFVTVSLAQPQLATSQSTDPAQNQNPKATTASESKDAQQSKGSPASPKVRTGKIKENQRFESHSGRLSVAAPAARNPFVSIYDFRESRLKYENAAEKVALDYEDVIFQIGDFGQAYGTGVRRIPESVLTQMANQEQKQILYNLAQKALLQWRDYAEEPQPVDEAAVQTQFGEGLLCIYLAKHSSLLARTNGADLAAKRKPEKSDARIAVLVVKKDDWFLYATAEDEYVGSGVDPLDLRKQLETFFASMTVKFPG